MRRHGLRYPESDPHNLALHVEQGTLLGVEAGPALSLLKPLPAEISVVLARFDGLCRDLLLTVRPDCVVTPLVAPNFDVLDLAQCLAELDYSGPLIAVTFPLPDRRVIEREVTECCAGIRLRVIELR